MFCLGENSTFLRSKVAQDSPALLFFWVLNWLSQKHLSKRWSEASERMGEAEGNGRGQGWMLRACGCGCATLILEF